MPIFQMEGVIKHAEESRVRAISNASRLHEEYLPLKQEVNRLRRECLGLERLPELHEEEGVHISAEYVRISIKIGVSKDE